MSRARTIILVVVVIGIAGGAFVTRDRWWRKPQDLASTIVQPNLTAISARVHCLGRLEPKGTVIRLAPQSGNEGSRVESLLVDEGDLVQPNQLVAVLDGHDRRDAALLEAKARLEAAEARLAQTQAGAKASDVEAAKTAVDMALEQKRNAERDYERVEKLAQKKVIQEEELTTKRSLLQKATLEWKRAGEVLESVKQVRETDVRVQQAEVKTAAAAVASAEAQLEAANVRARAAGRVLKIHSWPGERINDKGLMEIGRVDEMQAVAEVYESDVRRVRPGASAVVTLDSSGEKFTGTVDRVGLIVARNAVLANDPVADVDARVIEVRVSLRPEDAQRVSRLANARVEVDIAAEELDAGNKRTERPVESADETVAARPRDQKGP